MRVLTIVELLGPELIELGFVFGESQGVKGTTGVLPLLGVALVVSLSLNEGDGDHLDSEDDREVAPWHQLTQVSGLAPGCSCPGLGLHPVS